jgi:hypothetical protein
MSAKGCSLICFTSYELCKKCFDNREEIKYEEDKESDNENV